MAEDDSITGNKTVREMEVRIRELERQLGRKTLETEPCLCSLSIDKDGARLKKIVAELELESRSSKQTYIAQSPRP